jgi:ribonuclease BN (tRNA processing enzyme)
MPGRRTTCFLVNDNFMIDAGAATSALPLKDQVKIDAILLTHSHLDHIRDVGFLADNIFGKRDRPIKVFGIPETIKSLKTHVLNDSVWPDFSVLPDPENPVMSFHEMQEGIPMQVEGFSVRAVRVNHSVPAVGFLVNNGNKAFVFSGDTGPTEALWKASAKDEELQAVFLEASFPDRLADLAETTGHLTPSSALEEMKKLNRPELPVYLFHMKPQYLKEIETDVESKDLSLHIVEQGDHIEI